MCGGGRVVISDSCLRYVIKVVITKDCNLEIMRVTKRLVAMKETPETCKTTFLLNK